MVLTIVKYEDQYEERWDKFVLEKSINGTFLQTRNFLNYHPEERFKDASVLVMQGTNIVAVVPACDATDEGKRCFFSHQGSTFGGIVIDRGKYNISTLEELFPCLDEYLCSNGYQRVIMKCTSDVFAEKSMDLLDYYFFKHRYNQFDEIAFFMDVEQAPENLVDKLCSSRRRGYRHSLKHELVFRRLETGEEIRAFYGLLCKNLTKFGTTPVHTLEELLEFKNVRLRDVVDFYGVYFENKLIAGTMLFYFGNQVLHTQYLAQDIDYAHLYAMNFMDVNLIQLTREKGFPKFSFGISTEERGKVLNLGLALFKEGYGCDYCANRSYIKDF